MYFGTAQPRIKIKKKDRGRHPPVNLCEDGSQLRRNVQPGSVAKLLQTLWPRAVMGSREPTPGRRPSCGLGTGLRFSKGK